ncbi:hypothetical protein HCU40_11410 [Pseudanabaena biceps]|nr:hypothetical protein [Pseudanabaena biceps]
MAMFLYPVYTVCHAFLLIWAHYLYAESHQVGLIILIAIITAIVYDNLIISIGRWIGKGKTLLTLSQPRFLGHVILTPLSIIAAYGLCFHAGLGWANQPISILLSALVALSLIAAEILTYYKKFEPKIAVFQGTIRYTNSAYKIPPIPSIITTIIVGILGVVIWYQLNSSWLLISSIIMFFGGAIPQRLAGPLICSGVEVVLILGFCMTTMQLQSVI